MFAQFIDIHYIYIINNKIIRAMNILDFAINYPDEESCRKKFKELREQMGITCRHCNCKEHTGFKTNKPMNARVAMPAKPCVQALSCNTPTCLTVTGSSPCTCSQPPRVPSLRLNCNAN